MCLFEDLDPQWFHEDSLLHRAHRSAKPRTHGHISGVKRCKIFTYTVVIPPNSPAKWKMLIIVMDSPNVSKCQAFRHPRIMMGSAKVSKTTNFLLASVCETVVSVASFLLTPTSSSGLVGHTESKLHPFTLLIGMQPGSRSQIRNLEPAKLEDH